MSSARTACRVHGLLARQPRVKYLASCDRVRTQVVPLRVAARKQISHPPGDGCDRPASSGNRIASWSRTAATIPWRRSAHGGTHVVTAMAPSPRSPLSVTGVTLSFDRIGRRLAMIERDGVTLVD